MNNKIDNSVIGIHRGAYADKGNVGIFIKDVIDYIKNGVSLNSSSDTIKSEDIQNEISSDHLSDSSDD